MNGNGSVNLGRDSVTLEPLQLLQPTPKSLLFNIYHSRLGPQLLPDLHQPGPQAPPRPDRGGGRKVMEGVCLSTVGGAGGMELVLEEIEQETESNPMVGKGLKGQFTPVPDLGTVVKLL